MRQIGEIAFRSCLGSDARLSDLDSAAENLVGYSAVQPEIFKTGQLTPVKDLKLLIKDYPVTVVLALHDILNRGNCSLI